MNDSHVYVSLTTIDSRIGRVAQTVRSVLRQSYSDITVVLHLSRKPYLLDKGVSRIPDDLSELQRKDQRFIIRWVENTGPYRKLLPLLASLDGRSALIATVDDDTIYPEDWLSSLMRYYMQFRCVIANRAHPIVVSAGKLKPYRNWMGRPILRNPDLMLMPTGKDGVLYHTSYFSNGVLDYLSAKKVAPTADDIWFRWHTAMTNTPVYCTSTTFNRDTLPSTDTRPISLFGSHNKNGGNDLTIARIHEWALTERSFDIVRSSSDGGHYRFGS